MKKQDKKANSKLPILKNEGNNFVKFKAALSEVALEE